MPTSPTLNKSPLDKKPPLKKTERRALLWDILKKLAVFAQPYRLIIIATLILTVLGSFTAQVNAFVLRYAVDTLTEIATLTEPWEAGVRMLTIISVVLLTKEILSIFISFGQRFYGEKIRINLSRDLSQKIIERILTYRMAFYTSSENDSGKLQTRIDYGVSSLTSLVQNFFIDMLPLFASAIVSLIIMFSTNFWIGLVGLIIIPIYFFISQKQAKRLQGFRRQMRGFREAKSGLVISLINSISVVKSFVRESIEAEKHLTIQKDMTDNQLRIRSIGFIYDAIKTFIEQIGVVAIILLTSYFVLRGQMTIGMILFHVMLFQNVAAPIRQLHRIYDQINNALTYAEGFFEILEDDEQVEKISGLSSKNLKGHIELKNVDFTYPNGTQALKDVSFTIKPNRITALVGLSGLVLQSNHIFSGTISENIRYGDMNASDDDIVVAAKKASIHEQVISLEKGYDSSAKSLSGGQQQRIALARMFLKDPPIVFLDEPTASLDAIASQQVKKSLDLIKKDRTVIMVSHNIAQIIDADDLVVIENGCVVETGTHEALYEQRGKYFEIFSAMSDSLNLDKISQTLNS